VTEVPDEELTRAAQSGDVAALGTLLARHHAGMRAVALSLVGRGPDAEDAVQDATLVALRRIADVRDPAAVGPWLRTIVRHECYARLRAARRTQPVADLDPFGWEDGPERIVEEHAMRDWLWHAIDELSPPLRMVVLLRHFSGMVNSYERIAAVCGVPVGTVRSRLHQARAALADAMIRTAEAAHGDIAARVAESHEEARDFITATERGEIHRFLAERWSPDAGYFEGRRMVGGLDLVAAGMTGDREAGVRHRLVHVVAGRDIAIWELDLVNPADRPGHCPPAVSCVLSAEDGRVKQLRLFHAARGY
jgi:RNA polymerase sigma-70 factor (ECF subfamily)